MFIHYIFNYNQKAGNEKSQNLFIRPLFTYTLTTTTSTTSGCSTTDILQNTTCFSTSVYQETKYSTAFSGKNSFISPQSCPASVLLCDMISVGLFSAAMTLAMVKVLPEPVTPSKVSNWLPSLKPFTSCSIACGWSPVGLYFECSLNSITHASSKKILNTAFVKL